MEQVIKANAQLMARCLYNSSTGKATLENYSNYYPTPGNKQLFN